MHHSPQQVSAPEGATERPVGVGRSHRYLPDLEALRGWAILLVFSFHMNGHMRGRSLGAADEPTPLSAFVFAGHTGVSLFFVLSAFLLSLPFLEQAAGGRSVSLRAYATRRVLRIVPLYYAAVAVAVVLSAQQLADLARGLPYLLFLNSFAGWFTPLRPYSDVWWSLATEAQFYVVLPLLPLLLRRRAGRLAGLLVLLVYGAAYAAYLTRTVYLTSIPGQIRLGNSLFGRAPLFLLGIAAAALYRTHGASLRDWMARNPILRRGGGDVLLLAVLLGLGFLLRSVIVVGFWAAERPPLHAWHVMEGVLWSTVVLLVLVAPLRARALITNRWTIWLGVLSYSIYVWHLPVVHQVWRWARQLGIENLDRWVASTVAVAGVTALLCLGLSALTYRFIERPFLVRKERVSG